MKTNTRDLLCKADISLFGPDPFKEEMADPTC